jgi:carbon-monoxide dehydrogenase large subunit
MGRAVAARREDVRFLRAGDHPDDIELLASPRKVGACPHARPAVDARRRALPGVSRLTAADLDAAPLPVGGIEGAEIADAGHPVLAQGKVRYAGEPVALVVAESRALAEDAAELVDADYEPLEPVLDPRTAAAAPLVHEDVPANALVRWSGGR